MPTRTIASGDIHGCSAALRALLDAIQPGPGDELIFLGDYIDRGPDSKGVLDHLLALEGRCTVVPLLGNHEEMLLAALDSRSGMEFWLQFGGAEALRSYGVDDPRRLPRAHLEFVRRCRKFHEGKSHLFAHANYWPNRPMNEQPDGTLLWQDLKLAEAAPHYSGKTVILGHTPQPNRLPLDLGFLVCIDTGCGFGGPLTALDVNSGRFWQADQEGLWVRGPTQLRIGTVLSTA